MRLRPRFSLRTALGCPPLKQGANHFWNAAEAAFVGAVAG
jgi:hypothetical protein